MTLDRPENNAEIDFRCKLWLTSNVVIFLQESMSNFSRSGHLAKSRLEMEVLPIESDFSPGSTDRSSEDNLLDSESDNVVITEFAGNLTDASVEQPAFKSVRAVQALTSNDERLLEYTISDSRREQALTSIALSFVP